MPSGWRFDALLNSSRGDSIEFPATMTTLACCRCWLPEASK